MTYRNEGNEQRIAAVAQNASQTFDISVWYRKNRQRSK